MDNEADRSTTTRAVGTTTDSKRNKLSLCKEDQNASLWCPLEWGELLPLLVGSTLSKRLKPTMEPSLTASQQSAFEPDRGPSTDQVSKW